MRVFVQAQILWKKHDDDSDKSEGEEDHIEGDTLNVLNEFDTVT